MRFDRRVVYPVVYPSRWSALPASKVNTIVIGCFCGCIEAIFRGVLKVRHRASRWNQGLVLKSSRWIEGLSQKMAMVHNLPLLRTN